MSKLFIFDMGEVLLLGVETLPQMANLYSLDYAPFRADYGLYDTPLMEGFMDPSDFYRHMEIKYGLPEIKEDLFEKYFTPRENDFTLDIVDRLRAKGHRCVVGSNTFKPHWDHCYKVFPRMMNSFDSLYASHLIHIAKPDKAFWRYILKKEGYSPEETVFIDDRTENIESAASLGIETFQYLKDNKNAQDFFSRWIG